LNALIEEAQAERDPAQAIYDQHAPLGEKLQGLVAQHQLERLLRLNELSADIEALGAALTCALLCAEQCGSTSRSHSIFWQFQPPLAHTERDFPLPQQVKGTILASPITSRNVEKCPLN
jgi:hypothetical protein